MLTVKIMQKWRDYLDQIRAVGKRYRCKYKQPERGLSELV
jgi:hypothetical protein